ncbi:MAG: universal stress protein, partial [Pseudomonadales bacterium]
MQQPRNILVILDKPKHAQTALERALALAASCGAHLHLTSFCWLPMVDQTDVFDAHQRRAIKKSAMLERRRWLEALVLDRGLSAADISIQVVWTKDIAAWVAENAPLIKSDLLVKSVHHSRTLLHTPLDWSLLRRTPVPLLLVSTRIERRSGNVLATVDLYHADAKHRLMNRRVLEAAAELARLQNGKLHCATAIQVAGSFQDLDFFDARKARKQATDNARRELERSRSLRERDLTSQQDLDQVERRYREAELQLVTARERLELLETGRVSGSAGTGVESVVRAPITGYVLEKMVEVGDPVVPLSSYQEGTVLFAMADMGRLVFRGTVD